MSHNSCMAKKKITYPIGCHEIILMINKYIIKLIINIANTFLENAYCFRGWTNVSNIVDETGNKGAIFGLQLDRSLRPEVVSSKLFLNRA